jgi:signal transduction histidine kinase
MRKTYLIPLTIIALIASLFACDKREGKKQLSVHPAYSWADSMILREGIDAGDTARSYFLIDSLEKTGDLNELGAETFRLLTHQRFYHHDEIDAEVERLGRRIAAHNSLEDRKQWYYNYGVSWLAYELYMTHNYEGFLRVAVPLIASMDSLGNGQYDQMTNVLTMMACCYVKLGEPEKAKGVGDRARKLCWEILSTDSSGGIHQSLVNCYARVKDAYVMAQDWEQSKSWLELVDSVEQVFRRRYPNARVWAIYDGYIHLDRATKLWIMGQRDSAAAEYEEFCKYKTTREVNGYIQANDYLMPAGRWKEAAENYEYLDSFIKWRVPKVYLEEIHAYYLPKFRANINAGRKDSALYTAKQIAEHFDSAYMWQKRSQMAEMATVYDIQGKEMQIAEQKAKLMHTRAIALGVVVILLVIFFVIYALIRRRERKRLEEKNQQLTIANERAEESSRMKTKFIQQISHEFRTPLNILSGFAQVLTSGMTLDEDSREEANKQILENTNRITGLVNKMLELSEASSHTVIELTDHVLAVQIALGAVEASGIERASHLTFQLLLDEGCDTVELTTSQRAAVRALSLLLDNARKFTAPAEAYDHQASSDKKQRVVLKLSAVDGGVQFIVEDTGIGVPAKEAEHIFDEFVQLNEYYDGTGIGLTVARSLARRLGGDIQLDTTYTDGARFVMTLFSMQA